MHIPERHWEKANRLQTHYFRVFCFFFPVRAKHVFVYALCQMVVLVGLKVDPACISQTQPNHLTQLQPCSQSPDVSHVAVCPCWGENISYCFVKINDGYRQLRRPDLSVAEMPSSIVENPPRDMGSTRHWKERLFLRLGLYGIVVICV